MGRLSERLRARLNELRRRHLYRSPTTVAEGPGPVIRLQSGETLINFSSNDYLGLAGDAEFQRTVRRRLQGSFGSGAAHLLGGHHRWHRQLETELARWLQTERALLFSTGYMANLAVQQALTQKGDLLLHDRLNHASLLDGARLSEADWRRFPHNDPDALARRLQQAGERQTIIVTESVFSMDGDLAPLPAIQALQRAHGSWLIVDEAHAFGVLGEAGRGAFAHFGLQADEDTLRIGTLGKAFGAFGAFAAGSRTAIEALINLGRAYLFTTALSPAQAQAALMALEAVRTREAARERLRRHIARFRAGARQLDLPLGESATPIQPIPLGGSEMALQWQRCLRQAGFFVGAVRPPTVPRNQARLRIVLSAAHAGEWIDRLLEALAHCRRSLTRSQA